MSSDLSFWIKKAFFGAFKLVEPRDLIKVHHHHFFVKVHDQSFSNLFSEKFFDQKNRIYQTLKSRKKFKKIRDFHDFFRSDRIFWKTRFFYEKFIFMSNFKLSHRSDFLIFFSNFLCKWKLRYCSLGTLKQWNNHYHSLWYFGL